MMHLAELNIGKFKYPTTDPRMAEFMDNLDRVNALAERSPGLCLAPQGRQQQRHRIPHWR